MIPDGFEDEATCRTSGVPKRYFTEPRNQHEADEAKAVCEACPVKDACLAIAIALEPHGKDFRSGIWGGTTPLEREALARGWASR